MHTTQTIDIDVTSQGTTFTDVQLGVDGARVSFHCSCLEEEKDEEEEEEEEDNETGMKKAKRKELKEVWKDEVVCDVRRRS